MCRQKQNKQMTKEDALVKIKEQLQKLMSFSEDSSKEEETEKKFSTIKLKDGTEISILDGTELGVGVEVYGVDADGNQVPLEDGEYPLEDGRVIVVASGKVDSISEAKEEEAEGEKPAETPENPAKETMAEDKPEEGEKPEGGSAVEDRLAALESQVGQILEAIQGMMSAQEVAMSKIQEFSALPAEKSIKIGKEPYTPYKEVEVKLGSLKSEMDELKELKKKFSNSNYSFSASMGGKN